MRHLNVFLLLNIFIFTFCSKKSTDSDNSTNTPHSVNYELTHLWTTPPEFDYPEAVYYDKNSDFIYVSNMGTSDPYQVDNNGYISKLSLNGEIIDQHWITGLNGPLGMVACNGYLYVVDINRLIEIDTESNMINNIFTESSAILFNDIAVDTASGTFYISGFGSSRLYSFRAGSFEIRQQFTQSVVPNGLCLTGSNLYIGTANTIIQYDINTDESEVLLGGTGKVDGLEHFDNNIFIGSDFDGRVNLFTPPSIKKEILDLTGDNLYAANIDYVKSKRLLLIPAIYNNRIIAYEIDY